MKSVLSLLILLAALRASAQLSVGSTGMIVLAGTSLSIDGLILTPSASLSLANNSIQRTTTPLTGNPSINRLYQLSAPLLFSGRVGISYLPSELNGYTESTLQVAYTPTADAILTVTTSSNVNAATHFVQNMLTNQNLYVVTATALSDLTPILYARPSQVYGSSTFTVVVDVLEINSVATSGSFQVKISRDPAVNLSFDPLLTSLDNRSVQNKAWQFDASDESYYILTTTQSIAGSDQLSVGLTGVLNPGSTAGVLTVSASVIDQGLIERKLSNNTDADKVDYFQR